MESKRATGWYNKYMDEMKKIGKLRRVRNLGGDNE